MCVISDCVCKGVYTGNLSDELSRPTEQSYTLLSLLCLLYRNSIIDQTMERGNVQNMLM